MRGTPSRTRLDWRALCFWFAGLGIALGAFLLRTHQLDVRPIHGDEAVQGYLLGTMLEGEYTFNPQEYHGPLLHNLAAPIAWLRGEGAAAWQDLSLTTLRLVPALCTSALCLAPLLLWPWLTRWGALSASLLLAVNTMLVYFGRHYIAEGLLVTCLSFCLIFAWRTIAAYRSPETLTHAKYWAILASVSLACAWGTKATFFIQLAAALLALKVLAWLACLHPRFRAWFQPKNLLQQLRQPALKRLLLYSAISLLLSWLVIYSQAGKDPQGLSKSLTTYTTYAERTQGEGHEKPFGYFAQTLFADHYGLPPKPKSLSWENYFQSYIKHPRLSWPDYWELELLAPERLRPYQTEIALLILALIGLIACWLPKGAWLARNRPHPWLISWLMLTAALTLLLYSLIPYKTIWSVLGVPALLCFPAAIGFYWLAQWPLTLWKLKRSGFLRALGPLCCIILYLIILSPSFYVATNWRAQLIWQNYSANRSVSPTNPWVYSQAPTAFAKLPQRLQALAQIPAARPAHDRQDPIQVLCLHSHTPWPLPWYQRNLEKTPVLIGYFNQTSELPLQDRREAFRSQFAALIAGNEHLEEMSALAEAMGYRQSLFVQYYQHAHLALWIRDDLQQALIEQNRQQSQ